ncbi:SPOR domain-containing protein [Maricaulis sp.]|uniref:SPOR domain-containing protein n=1 Tax=Maricaulis sp. TaxID=1486257 RepID=UPI003A9186B8
MKTSHLLISLLAGASVLGGCATTGAATAPQTAAALPPVAETQDARIADLVARELGRRARHDAASLADVSPELRALAQALAGPAPEPAVAGDGARGGMLPPAPAEMLDAPSLWHGIHLASYRIHANAVSGWAELQARFPAVLADREARLAAVTLPGRGDFLRLEAGPYDSLAEAREACMVIERAGAYCMPVEFAGQPMTDFVPPAAR